MRSPARPKPCLGPYDGTVCPQNNKATPMGLRCALCRHTRQDWQATERAKRLRGQAVPRHPSGYNRRAQIVRMERLAKQLNIQAMLNQRACEKGGEHVDAKMWWRVASSAAEQVRALQEGRQAPTADQPPMRVEPPPQDLDHQDVPPLKPGG